MGLETPYVPWGCHPELVAYARRGRRRTPGARRSRFVFPGGFLGHRKPLEPVLEAFEATDDPRLRLVVKAQVERKQRPRRGRGAAERDPRIELRLADQPTAEHLRELAGCDVCLAPARWEGLGLPLYEAIAFGMPGDHQRRAADERGDPRRRERAPRSTRRERDGEVGDPRARPRRRRAATRRSSASPTTRCAPSWPPERCACATASGPGTTTVAGIGELLETAANG